MRISGGRYRRVITRNIDQYKNRGEAEVFITGQYFSIYTRSLVIIYLYLSMRKLKSKKE